MSHQTAKSPSKPTTRTSRAQGRRSHLLKEISKPETGQNGPERDSCQHVRPGSGTCGRRLEPGSRGNPAGLTGDTPRPHYPVTPPFARTRLLRPSIARHVTHFISASGPAMRTPDCTPRVLYGLAKDAVPCSGVPKYLRKSRSSAQRVAFSLATSSDAPDV